MSRISCLPGFTVVPACSTSAAVSRAASVLLGAFSRRLMVDCEASGAPVIGQRPTATFISGVMPQPVEVDGILLAARDGCDARHHHLEHIVPNAARIAAIRHRIGKSSAHPELALRLPQQQQAAVRRLVAAGKIHCEVLALDRWQVKGKVASVMMAVALG